MNNVARNLEDCPYPAAGMLSGPLVVAALAVGVLALNLGGFCVAALLRPVRLPAGASAGAVPVR